MQILLSGLLPLSKGIPSRCLPVARTAEEPAVLLLNWLPQLLSWQRLLAVLVRVYQLQWQNSACHVACDRGCNTTLLLRSAHQDLAVPLLVKGSGIAHGNEPDEGLVHAEDKLRRDALGIDLAGHAQVMVLDNALPIIWCLLSSTSGLPECPAHVLDQEAAHSGIAEGERAAIGLEQLWPSDLDHARQEMSGSGSIHHVAACMFWLSRASLISCTSSISCTSNKYLLHKQQNVLISSATWTAVVLRDAAVYVVV